MSQSVPPEAAMEAAIAQAKSSDTPYGAVIVKDGEIVAKAGNTVQPDSDPSAHAEVNAMRQLTANVGEAMLSGDYVLYSTCEPCAMCAATAVWSGMSKIVYGVGADDFDENPNVIELRCHEVIGKAPKEIAIESGLLKDDCKKLHETHPV